VVNGNGLVRRSSDERANGQPRMTPPGHEKLTITTSSSSQRDEWHPPINGDRQPYQPVAFSEAEGSHKRKRSGSVEQVSSTGKSYINHAAPSLAKPTPPLIVTTAISDPDGPAVHVDTPRPQTQPETRDHYNTEGQYRHYIAEDNRDPGSGSEPWNPRQYLPQPHVTSDEQLGEVLQRASQNMDSHHHEYASPGDDDPSGSPYSPYSNRDPTDPKKRKRNFSNRTKTGCMTCRRRKKKCDEARPECK
jgi:hypothetical protein